VPRRTSKTPDRSAFEAAVGLLARRAHSRVELRRKLARRGYAEEEVVAAVTRLGEMRLQDDGAFAAGHVRRRAASRGPLALSAELAARGVDRGLVDEALAGLTPEVQLASAIDLAGRLAARSRPAGYQELLDRVGTKLVRRGFAPYLVRAACQAVWRGTDEPTEA
jgi:regulatory protein